MPSPGAVRAGGAYTELWADDTRLVRGLRMAERRIRAFGTTVRQAGQDILKVGAVLATPFAAGVKAFSRYEDQLAALRSTANPTAEQMERIKSVVTEISKAAGTGPAEVAGAMTELLKAGLPLESVLSGAAEAALQFAKVGSLEAAEAAIVLTDAMNVFGVDATQAVNALSRAADASSISIQDIAVSFSQASAVAGQAGLSIEETANAIAVLGQNGIKGSDAGTSLRTMLNRLKSGADGTGDAMRALGIRVRDNAGNMRNMRSIIGELQMRLGGLAPEVRDIALYELFGSDAIRSATVFLKEGTAGWDAFSTRAADSLSVADKFKILMGTMSGSVVKAWAAIQRLAVTVGEALVPALRFWSAHLSGIIDRMSEFVARNKTAVAVIGGAVLGIIAVGGAAVIAGVAIQGLSFAFTGLITAVKSVLLIGKLFGLIGPAISAVASLLPLLISPIGLIVIGLAAAGAAFVMFTDMGQQSLQWLGDRFAEFKDRAKAAFKGIGDALASGNIALAGKILWAALRVEFQRGINYLNTLWQEWSTATREVFAGVSFFLARAMIDGMAGVQSAWIKTVGFLQDAWTVFVASLERAFNRVAGLISSVIARVMNPLGGEGLDQELERIRQRTADKDAAVDQRTNATLLNREAERKQDLASVESDRVGGQAALDDQEQAKIDELRAAAAASIAKGDGKLAELQAEYEALLAEAAAKRKAGEDQIAGGGTGAGAVPGSVSPEPFDPAGLSAGMAGAERRSMSRGVTSSFGLGGVGADSLVQKQLDQQMESNGLLKKIAKNTGQAGVLS